MSASAMLSLNVHLDIQSGEIPPTIHLKEGSEPIAIHLQIAVTEATHNTGGTAILEAIRPDNSELFIVLPVSRLDVKFISVELEAEQIAQMTTVTGKFEGTISIIDSENVISEADNEDYGLIAVQPFILEVQESAAV